MYFGNHIFHAKEPKIFVNASFQELMHEIIDNGPIYVSMISNTGFANYSSGIFIKSENDTNKGGHAVKILGWGRINSEGPKEDLNNYYWIGANSWTEDWGENGFFRIGVN